jgi:predicted peroxiredoxin
MNENERQTEIDNLEKRMKHLMIENENKDNIIQEKVDKIDELIKIMDEEREERQKDRQMLRNLGIHLDDVVQQNNELIDKVDDIQIKLNISVEDRAPKPDLVSKRERFILLKRDDESYPYYIIRAQDVNAKASIRKQKNLYNNVSLLLDLQCQPNSKTLYVRIKDQLKKQGVEFNLCKVSIDRSELKEHDLVEVMKGINDEKLNI